MNTFDDEVMREYIQRAKELAKSRMEAIESSDDSDERKAIRMEYNDVLQDILLCMDKALQFIDCNDIDSETFIPDPNEDIFKLGIAVRTKGLYGMIVQAGKCNFSELQNYCDREYIISQIKSTIVAFIKNFAHEAKLQSGLYPMTPLVKYDITVEKYDGGFSVYLHYETPQFKLL